MKVMNCVSTGLFYILVFLIFITATYLGSEVTSVVAQLIPVERKHTIIIDAGHGGVDGGATSCTGVLESKLNLDIALKLNDLMHLLGYKTRMIRTSDISVYTKGETIAQKKVSDLKERVRIVNETEDGILISIHQNTFSDSQYSGAQVFYGAEGEGAALAAAMQDAFCRTVNPGSSRKSKKAETVYLLQNIDRTGVLVECGFLSNPKEEAQLRSDDYQRKLCCVIASATAQFLQNANT